jgi:hypothetical protein
MGITHFSNVDAGSPFNNDYEDNAEHTGVNIEYQYHLKRVYFYSSISIGKNKAKRDSNAGWNCTGCALPSELRIGVKWRVW